MPPLLQIQNLSKSYPSAAGPVSILKGLDLEVERGESVAIVGASGSGKSTLLQLIGTLDTPDSGSIVLDGTNIAGLGGEAVARIRNLQIGFVFQSHHLLPQCTTLENILVPTLASKRDRAQSKQLEDRARALLKRVGLESRLHHRPSQLFCNLRQHKRENGLIHIL